MYQIMSMKITIEYSITNIISTLQPITINPWAIQMHTKNIISPLPLGFKQCDMITGITISVILLNAKLNYIALNVSMWYWQYIWWDLEWWWQSSWLFFLGKCSIVLHVEGEKEMAMQLAVPGIRFQH